MGQPISVMFVEDDVEIRRNVEAALASDRTIVVQTVASGAEALDMAEQAISAIDVVLLNVILPDMSGLEVAQALRAFYATSESCIALVTASVSDEQIASFRSPEIAEVIVKPFDVLKLQDRVRSLANDCA